MRCTEIFRERVAAFFEENEDFFRIAITVLDFRFYMLKLQ
jgi:hypothetical protein